MYQPTTAEVAEITTRLHNGKDDAIVSARQAGLIVIEGRGTVRKYAGDVQDDNHLIGIVESTPNLMLTAGITAVWNLVAGAGGSAFNSTNARIAIGTSSTAAVIGNTTLGTESARQIVDGAPTVSTNQISWVCTFATGTANVAWAETCVVNASSAGTLLNRLVSVFGTKTSAASWVYTHTLTMS